MTAPSDKELRDKIIGIILGDYNISIDKSRLEELLALVRTAQQQLLNELLEQKKTHKTLVNAKDDYWIYDDAVPVEAIQKYLDKEAE